MSSAVALDLWRRRARSCRRRYKVFQTLWVASWIATVLVFIAGIATGAAGVNTFVVSIGANLAYARRSYRRQLLFLRSAGVTRLEAPHDGLVLPLLADIVRELGMNELHLVLLLDRTRADCVPSVAQAAGRTFMLLPLGFFGVLGDQPAAALAMLAHELGHVAQGDVRLGAWVAAYAALVSRFAVLIIVGSALVLGFATGGILVVMHLGRNEVMDRSDAIRLMVISTLAYLGLFFGAVLVATALIRWLRRLSENTADLAAVAVVGPEAVQAALALVTPHQPPGLFSVHPSQSGRSKFIAAALGSDPRSGP